MQAKEKIKLDKKFNKLSKDFINHKRLLRKDIFCSNFITMKTVPMLLKQVLLLRREQRKIVKNLGRMIKL